MTNKTPSIVSRITIDSKSILARLLAAENIIVEHVPSATTACFETDTRRLVLPVWEGMDEDTYDMLVGHEIGHAIYTPADADAVQRAIDAIDSTNPALVKHYLNIVEDARIERLMKRRYPGLTHNFRRAYTRMYDGDMFGFKRSVTDPSTLCTIDRLNLRAKVGVHAEVDIVLNSTEQVFFGEMMRTETFDEMVDLTRRIYEYAKEPQGEQPEEGDGTYVDSGPGDGEGNGGDIMDDHGGSGGGGGSASGPKPSDQQPDNKGAGTSKQPESSEGKAQPPKPITNDYQPREDKRINAIDYFDMPADFNIDPYIRSSEQVLRDFAKVNLSLRGYDEFRQDSRKYVNMLVKEFELRKAADMHSRTSIARSGVLDMNRLHQHKYVEDIFRRNAVVRAGKNHGMVMIVDGSSSMQPVYDNTIRQVMQLAWFCRACNIPFDVYIFSNSLNPAFETVPPKVSNRPNDIHLGSNFSLFQVASSNMSSTVFARSMMVLYHLGHAQWHAGNLSCYNLSGTPLFKSMIAARYVVDRFRRRNNLQVVNTIILTDGEDADRFYNSGTKEVTSAEFCRYRGTVGVVRDMATRMQVSVPQDATVQQGTEAMLNLLRSSTGSNVVGFYVINSSGGKRVLSSILGVSMYNNPDFDAKVAEFRNNKFLEVKTPGYDAFFVVPGDQLGMRLDEKEDYLNKSLTKGRIANAFLKNERAKQVNRVLLSRFVGWISR